MTTKIIKIMLVQKRNGNILNKTVTDIAGRTKYWQCSYQCCSITSTQGEHCCSHKHQPKVVRLVVHVRHQSEYLYS